jgi:XTP/dITP diphosphohydrolase
MKLIFATNNANKVKEISNLLPNGFEIITLKNAGIDQDIPEPFDTLEENARTKSATIYNLTQQNCFGEDTGLFVDVLGNEPGVKSARYSGDDSNDVRNIKKLLDALNGEKNRAAHFRTIISLIISGKEYQFTGICEGRINLEPKGENGFGYDPIFIPNGAEKTFAEMMMAEKSVFSHRKKAVAKLVDFLKTI